MVDSTIIPLRRQLWNLEWERITIQVFGGKSYGLDSKGSFEGYKERPAIAKGVRAGGAKLTPPLNLSC